MTTRRAKPAAAPAKPSGAPATNGRKPVRPARAAKPKLITGSVHLAKALEVSRQTVDAWIGRGLPLHVRAIPPKPHVFDLAAVKAWLAAEGLQQDVDLSAPKNRAEADLALVLQKIRAARAGADKAELGLKVRKGELLEAAEVERGRIERITAVTSALEAMPGKLAPELVGRDARAIQARIAEEVTRIREDFAK